MHVPAGGIEGRASRHLALLAAVGAVCAGGAAVAAADIAPLLFVGLAAGIGVVLCVQRLDVGLAVLIGLTFTYAFDVGEKDHGMQSLRLPFAALLLLAWVFSQRPGEAARSTAIPRLLVVTGAYAAFLLASTFWAADPRPVFAGVISLLKILLVVLTVVALTTDLRTLRLAVWSLIIAGGALAVFSIHQHLTGSFGQDYLGFAKAPVRNIAGDTQAPRVAGPIGDPNSYAQMMVVVVPLALERFVSERRRVARIAASAAAAACGVTTILTFSRGALLSLVVVLGLFVLRHPPRIRHVVVAGALLLPLVPLLPSAYTARATSVIEVFPGSGRGSGDEVIQARSTLMTIASDMVRDHPLVGVGVGNYVVRFPEYNRRYGLQPYLGMAPHNLYLEIAAETGLMGLGLWGLIVASAFQGLAIPKRRPESRGDEDVRGLAEGLGLALAAFLVNSLFLHGSYPMAFWLLVALSLAVGQVGAGQASAREATEPVPAPARALRG